MQSVKTELSISVNTLCTAGTADHASFAEIRGQLTPQANSMAACPDRLHNISDLLLTYTAIHQTIDRNEAKLETHVLLPALITNDVDRLEHFLFE